MMLSDPAVFLDAGRLKQLGKSVQSIKHAPGFVLLLVFWSLPPLADTCTNPLAVCVGE